MLGINITISGTTHYLDLFEDGEFKLNSSFAEIQDITKRNSTYSASFYVPGSKKNNDIFQHFFYLNSTFTDFDVRRKMDAVLTYNGYEMMTGYIRLNFVNVENRDVLYNITFYNEVGNLLANIGDKLMRDLDLDDMKHPYDAFDIAYESIKDPDLVSPTGTTAYETGKSYWFLGHFGYEYTTGNTLNTDATPKLNFAILSGGIFSKGYFDDPATPLRSYYLKPSIQFKELYTRIFNEAGYSVESDFFDTAYFKRWYLPQSFNDEGLYLLQGTNIEYQTSQTGDPINNQSIFWNNTDPTYTFSGYRAKLTPTLKDNMNAHATTGDYIFEVNATGIYQATLSFQAYNNERVPDTINLSAYLDVYFHQILSGTTTGTTLYKAPTITIAPGGAGAFSYKFSWFANDGDRFAIDYQLAGLGTAVITSLDFNIINGPKIVSGDFDYALEFPDDKFKQVEFIQAVNNLFNLVVVPKVGEPETLIVEPVIDFIGKGPVLDWTRKIDHNQPIQISPTTNLINGVINYNIEKDTDNGNEQFFGLNNQVFGSKQVDLNTDYKETQITYGSVFGSSVDYVLQNQEFNNATLPIFYVLETEEAEGQVQQFFRPFRTLPRPLFRGVNLPGRNILNINISGTTFGESWYLDQTNIDVLPLNNRFTTYPFGLSGFSHYTNFNRTHYYDNTEALFPNSDDMETIYYQDYIQDLIDPDNRILDCYVYLTQEELKDIQYNEKIFIDGNYYRINKIENYNLDKEEPVAVQLVKLTRDYEPHRKKCYKLTACDDPADIIYTNTDLTYGIFAFIGRFMKINGFCYVLEEIECGNYDYQEVKTIYSGSSLIPVVYTDCDCDIISNILTITDDTTPPEPSPSPSPTPTSTSQPTPTPTPTPTITSTPQPTPTPSSTPPPCICEEWSVENENPYLVNYQYTDCDGVYHNNTLGSFQTDYICLCQGSSITSTGGSVITSFVGECPLPTPTPTGTPTPTPSATPSLCYTYEITNESSESQLQYEYILCGDCEVSPSTAILDPLQIAQICACNGSVAIISGFGNVVKGAACP